MCLMHVQLCLTFCNPMDCSLPGSSVHGIFPTRMLEWVAIFSSGDLLLILTLKDKTRRHIISVTKQECIHKLDVYVLISKTVTWASLVAEMVKNLPAIKDTWVRSLCPKDSLEKGMATNSSVFAWKIP